MSFCIRFNVFLQYKCICANPCTNKKNTEKKMSPIELGKYKKVKIYLLVWLAGLLCLLTSIGSYRPQPT